MTQEQYDAAWRKIDTLSDKLIELCRTVNFNAKIRFVKMKPAKKAAKR